MASPFSFHCMICFEEFQVESRYPVVLPCGHTYVCNQCAERLDRCMECRTPLFQIIPRGPVDPQAGGWSTRSSAGYRSNQHQQPPKPSQPPIKKRLPLPKNVVLMSLIEATELAAENVRGREEQPSLTNSPVLNLSASMLDMDDDEEEKIKTGTSLAISDSGTYAVAAKDGLEIFPSRPEAAFQSSAFQSSGRGRSEEDVDTLVRFFHLDHFENGGKTKTGETAAPPARLAWGDRVQIVSTEAGWAKLARGYGFVRAGGHQLVKVGGSVDRACKLEALLRLLSTRRNELREEQMKADNHFIALMNDLQASLAADEDLTVIAADTFNEKTNTYKEDEKKNDYAEVRDTESSGNLLGQELRSVSNDTDSGTPLKPRPMARPETPPGDTGTSRGFFCAGAGDVFDTMIPLSSGSANRQLPTLPASTPSAAIVEELSRAHPHRYRTSSSTESTPTRLPPSTSHPSPNALKAGARAWREMHGRPASMGIDFRTGMSGHSALSAKTHPHDYLEPRATSSFRGMSNHTGLTMWKWKSGKQSGRQQIANSLGLAMPSFFGGASTHQDEGSTVNSSGSN